MIDIFVFLLYRFALIPWALFALRLCKPFLSPKLKQMLEERSTPQRPVLWARPIWIHAASGEIEYAKPVIRELKSKYPEIPILVTYFSPSALKLVQGLADVDFILPLPFDHRSKIKDFIAYANPIAVLFARTDVWPELAFQLRQRQIPSLLFSATLSQESGRVHGWGRSISRFAFDQLTQISCVNEEDERNFAELRVAAPVSPQGDTRFDQAIFRLQNPKALKPLMKPLGTKVLVAGSTWPQDEDILLKIIPDWIAANGEVILAPHEVTDAHLQNLETKMSSLNLKFQRYSLSDSAVQGVITVVDQIGILPELYSWGTVAFVGGSFKDKVHSVMEPLAAGLPVIVGPYHINNREALHFQNQFFKGIKTVVTSVANSTEFAKALLSIAEENDLQKFQDDIRGLVLKKSGASEVIANWVPLVEKISSLQPRHKKH